LPSHVQFQVPGARPFGPVTPGALSVPDEQRFDVGLEIVGIGFVPHAPAIVVGGPERVVKDKVRPASAQPVGGVGVVPKALLPIAQK